MNDNNQEHPALRRADWYLTRGAGIALLCLGALPVAAWIPGGMVDPAYGRRWVEWAYGTAICVGIAVLAAIVARRAVAVRLPRVLASALERLVWPPARMDAAIAVGCGVLYAVIAWTIFDGKPLLIDEIVQVLQARMYAAGHLSTAVSPWPEFQSVLHVVDTGSRFYSQFPPGWPAMLALGTLIHAEWLVGPICGAAAVFAFAKLLRRLLAPQEKVGVLLGTVLFGLGPFAAFQFSSHMSHGPFVMWLVFATLALSHAIAAEEISQALRWGSLVGLSAGCAFAVRPLDAVAYGVVAGMWLIWRARNGRAAGAVLASATIGLFVPVLGVMWVNVHTTGSPTEFGYQVLWGTAHGLGFHPAPWGDAHTPQRGLELLSLYATRLNVYLFETPFPSLLPVIVGLMTIPRLSGIERFLLIATGVHGLLYLAYWHDGFYLGPRFVTPWIPLLVLLCVRAGQQFARANVRREWRAGMSGALVAAVVLTVAVAIPSRAGQYRAGLVSMREDYGREAMRAGVHDAIVFVHESWGAQIVARLWALGVTRSATAGLYAHVDACVLEHAVSNAEQRGARGPELEAALRPLLADSLLVRSSNVSPDTTERMLPGTVYDSTCSARVVADREGYALYPPFLLDNRSGNLYMRDFEARDSLVRHAFIGQPAYVVTRDGVDGTSPLRWVRLP